MTYYNEQMGGIKILLILCVLELIAGTVTIILGYYSCAALFGAALVHLMIYFGFKVLTIEHKNEDNPHLSIRFGPLHFGCWRQTNRLYYSDIEYFTITPFRRLFHGYGLHFRRCGTLVYSNPPVDCCSCNKRPDERYGGAVAFSFVLKSGARMNCCCCNVQTLVIVTTDYQALKDHLIQSNVTYQNQDDVPLL